MFSSHLPFPHPFAYIGIYLLYVHLDKYFPFCLRLRRTQLCSLVPHLLVHLGQTLRMRAHEHSICPNMVRKCHNPQEGCSLHNRSILTTALLPADESPLLASIYSVLTQLLQGAEQQGKGFRSLFSFMHAHFQKGSDKLRLMHHKADIDEHSTAVLFLG